MATPLPSKRAGVFVAQIDKEWGFEGFFDGIYGDVIEEILKKYNMQRARDPNVAFRYLRDPTNHPIAVLVPDAGIIKGKHKKVMENENQHNETMIV